jgi:hypothetical protein
MDTCYMCDAPATSKEHAPPKCIFPEGKDLEDGSDLRKNLIKVPSCAEHNLRYSSDDEYFFFIVALNIDGNARKQRQFDTKVLRAVRRNPEIANSTFAQDLGPALLDGRPAHGGCIFRDRIERVIEKTTRAIHYHSTHGHKLTVPLSLYLPSLRLDDGRMEEGKFEAWQIVQRHLSGLPWQGDNPDVFRFRAYHYPKAATSFLWMQFYEGFDALVQWEHVQSRGSWPAAPVRRPIETR